MFKSSFLVNYYYFLKVLVRAHLSVAASGIFSCGMQDLVPWPGIKTGPLPWECRVWVTGPPEKSHTLSLKSYSLHCPPSSCFHSGCVYLGLHCRCEGFRYLQCRLYRAGELRNCSRGVGWGSAALQRAGSSSPTKNWTMFPELESGSLTTVPQEKSSPRILRRTLLRLLKWDFRSFLTFCVFLFYFLYNFLLISFLFYFLNNFLTFIL